MSDIDIQERNTQIWSNVKWGEVPKFDQTADVRPDLFV